MAGLRTRMLKGFAQLIDMHTNAVWLESGSYAEGVIGITIQAVPERPDGVVTLSAYSVTDDPALSDSVIGLQVRVRRGGANPTPTNDLADELFDLLHGLSDFELPAVEDERGVWVVSCVRRSQVPGGQDGNRRWSDIQNFYVTIHAPSAHRE